MTIWGFDLLLKMIFTAGKGRRKGVGIGPPGRNERG